jgi:hypothetical protein
MTDKYYTPTIEEFHPGFECEFFEKGKWSSIEVYDIDFEFDTKLLKEKRFRVKHLDREDIESLSEGETSKGLFILKDSEFDYERILCIIVEGNYVIIGNDLKGNEYEQLFQGKIKNKSELKKLLKQLEI